MIVHYADNFFQEALPKSDLILVETGTLITASGMLRLTSQSGLEITRLYNGIEKELGTYFSSVLNPVKKLRAGEQIYENYYLLISPSWPDKKMGFIQTSKHNAHFDETITHESVRFLSLWMADHPDMRVDLPLLGSSHPYVNLREVVDDMADQLGDNAHVWFPLSMIPRRVCLPDDHMYKDIVETEGSFVKAGKMRYRDMWDRYLSTLYSGVVGSSQATRLIQWMAIEQYAMSGDMVSAYVVSRSRMEQIVVLYGVKDGE